MSSSRRPVYSTVPSLLLTTTLLLLLHAPSVVTSFCSSHGRTAFSSSRHASTTSTLYPSPFRSSPLKSAVPQQLDDTTATYQTTDTAVRQRRREVLTKPPPASRRRQENGKIVTMKFVGKKTVSVPPSPLPLENNENNKSLLQFFAKEQHRNILFLQNGIRLVSNPTRQQMMIWSAEEERLGGSGRKDDGSTVVGQRQVLQMEAQIKMPGLKVISETTVGAKLVVLPNDDGDEVVSYPEYQFTVIETKLKPEGATPLVWLFKQLTKYMDRTSSFTRVRALNPAGHGDRVVFVTDARLETKINIPSRAMRLLPVDGSKFERSGTQAMQRLLEKELEPALLNFRDAYMKWISN